MSDEITPALSAEEWAEVRFAPLGCSELVFHDDGDGFEIVIYPDAAAQEARRGLLDKFKMSFPDDIRGVIAIANAALPNDSPYKITRADVEMFDDLSCHFVFCDSLACPDPAECDCEGPAMVKRLAAKLRALLPPSAVS